VTSPTGHQPDGTGGVGGADGVGGAGGVREGGEGGLAELTPGLRGSVQAVVGESDTAAALGSGDVPVLGTPRLLALAEAATVAALAGRLPPGDTTVGTSVALQHRRPSPVGAAVAVEAELTGVDGSRLTFSFTARNEEPDQIIGTGTIERAVVRREPFLAALSPPPPGRAGRP
jgi:fluoroacetyl-CoA thioesterase